MRLWTQRGRGGKPLRVRLCAWLCLSIACGTGGAWAAVHVADDPAAMEEAPESANEEIHYAFPTTLDNVGRILAPVTINGRGPFRFVLDTGANRSVLSPRVAESLQLAPSAMTSVEVHGVTGSAVLPAVEVAVLQAGGRTLAKNKRMPVLPGPVLADADGILGNEGLLGSRIEVDFRAGTVVISRSRGIPAEPGTLIVPLTLRHRGLLVANARVGRVRVKAIIDTGAERTLGNLALREALGIGPSDGPRGALVTIHGATAILAPGTSVVAPTIYLGDTELEHLEVTFGDLHVFRLWGLERQPALLIGMDLLGTVHRLVIDYRRRELQIEPRAKASATGS